MKLLLKFFFLIGCLGILLLYIAGFIYAFTLPTIYETLMFIGLISVLCSLVAFVIIKVNTDGAK